MRVGILGLGAIGSSIGLALRARKGWDDVTGYDLHVKTQNDAKKRGAIKMGTSDIADLLIDADIVVLATPALSVLSFLREHANTLRAGTVVTDVASSKRSILDLASRTVPERSAFVGGHPFVEVEAGIEHADAGVFQGKTWALAPALGARADRLSAVEALVEAVGASPYFVDPEEHDGWVAGVTQLPRMLAASLVQVVSASDAWRELASVAGRSFDDGTRWAGQPPVEGRDLALTNGDALVSWLDRVIAELYAWREAVAESREQELEQSLLAAKAARERWLIDRHKERRKTV